jgi:hypothetical protein
LRVPTWAPFRLQFYCNGHNWLAGRLRREKIAFTQQDNAIGAVIFRDDIRQTLYPLIQT